MQQAIDTFKLNIESVKQLDIIYQYLEQNNIKTLDLSEILRAELVLAVSALDNFISDVLYIGLVETFEGNRNIPADFDRPFNEFQVDMQTLTQIVNAPNPNDKSLILGNYIRKINSKNPYQDPKQIESALLLLGVKQLWIKLGTELSVKPKDLKDGLANIVWQRHKIAHEADFDHLTQKKRPRDRATTLQAIEFIEKLCSAIHGIVSTN
jgi:RiboL-PSP-HEPN